MQRTHQGEETSVTAPLAAVKRKFAKRPTSRQAWRRRPLPRDVSAPAAHPPGQPDKVRSVTPPCSRFEDRVGEHAIPAVEIRRSDRSVLALRVTWVRHANRSALLREQRQVHVERMMLVPSNVPAQPSGEGPRAKACNLHCPQSPWLARLAALGKTLEIIEEIGREDHRRAGGPSPRAEDHWSGRGCQAPGRRWPMPEDAESAARSFAA